VVGGEAVCCDEAAGTVSCSACAGRRLAVEADNGPVSYLATQIGAMDEAMDEATMRWFILEVALLLDPAAVLLLLAATA